MSNKSLRSILNENIENHKLEIKKISKGILLNKSELTPTQKLDKWIPVKKLGHSEGNYNKKNLKMKVLKDETFNSKLLMFAVGSDFTVNRELTGSSVTKPIKLRAMDSQCKIANLVTDAPVSAPTILCNNIAVINRSPERYNFSSPRYLRRYQIKNESESLSCNSNLVPHYIHPRYKTQYEQLLRFRNDNVREDDEREQNLLLGTNLIHHLELRLQKKLENLDKIGRGPNFVRLKMFSDIFSDLISESWMFAPLLIRIKSAYDDEVERVLEMPVEQRDLLLSEVEQLKNSIYHKEKLDNLQSELVQLEDAINVCIESEVSYNNVLLEEKEKLEILIKEKANFDEERKKRYKPTPIALVPTKSEKLELLKVECWDLMDDISKIQRETRQNLVSRATVAHLSEGLQDIGIEVEKLNYHKNQLLAETDDMRKELYEYIDEEEMREADFRLIESLLTSPSPDYQFTDYQQSHKWTWYIS